MNPAAEEAEGSSIVWSFWCSICARSYPSRVFNCGVCHYSLFGLHLSKARRLMSPFFSWFGLVGCFVLLFFIPPVHLVLGVITLALAFGARFIVRRQFMIGAVNAS